MTGSGISGMGWEEGGCVVPAGWVLKRWLTAAELAEDYAIAQQDRRFKEDCAAGIGTLTTDVKSVSNPAAGLHWAVRRFLNTQEK